MERPLRVAKLAEDFKEVDKSCALAGEQLRHEGPSEICPGCDAV